MFGENSQLITKQCSVCKKMIAMCVDLEDVERLESGVSVQFAFIRRDGRPYLTASERELFISECCDTCFHLLCPSDKLAYN